MKLCVLLLCAVLALSGCAAKKPEPPAPTQQTVAVETTVSQEKLEEAALMMYDWVLDMYRQALAEKWEPLQCMEKEISYMVAFQEELRYALIDLDGNGNLELLIRSGDVVLDAYTLTDNGPKLILSGGERNFHMLTQKEGDPSYYIYNHGSNSAFNSVVNIYRWNGTELDLVEALELDAEKDAEKPWFRREGEQLIPITEAEFEATEAAYRPCAVDDHAL